MKQKLDVKSILNEAKEESETFIKKVNEQNKKSLSAILSKSLASDGSEFDSGSEFESDIEDHKGGELSTSDNLELSQTDSPDEMDLDTDTEISDEEMEDEGDLDIDDSDLEDDEEDFEDEGEEDSIESEEEDEVIDLTNKSKKEMMEAYNKIKNKKHKIHVVKETYNMDEQMDDDMFNTMSSEEENELSDYEDMDDERYDDIYDYADDEFPNEEVDDEYNPYEDKPSSYSKVFRRNNTMDMEEGMDYMEEQSDKLSDAEIDRIIDNLIGDKQRKMSREEDRPMDEYGPRTHANKRMTTHKYQNDFTYGKTRVRPAERLGESEQIISLTKEVKKLREQNKRLIDKKNILVKENSELMKVKETIGQLREKISEASFFTTKIFTLNDILLENSLNLDEKKNIAAKLDEAKNINELKKVASNIVKQINESKEQMNSFLENVEKETINQLNNTSSNRSSVMVEHTAYVKENDTSNDVVDNWVNLNNKLENKKRR